MNLSIKEKDKQIVFIALFIVFILGDIVMVLGWQYRLFSQNRQTLINKKRTMSNLESDIKNLEKTKKESGVLDNKVSDFSLSVVDEKNISALIENISNLAVENDVKITQIKPVTDGPNFNVVELKDGKFKEIEIQITGKAAFHKLGNFINRIETSQNFFKVVSLDIEVDVKDQESQNIRLSLRTFVNII